MFDLQVFVTPSSVPCSSSGDSAADPPPVQLQITVANITATPVDLTDSGLRFEFAVDSGGEASASALILTGNSSGQTDDPPQPVGTVLASPVAGTDWSITPAQDSPCAFLALPAPATATSTPAVIAPQANVSFLFTGILVDLVPGVSAIAVTVQPAGAVSTTGPSYVTKTAAGIGITGFTASPILVAAGGTSNLTWSTTGADYCQLTWSPSGGVVVSQGGTTLTNPASNLPAEIDEAVEITVTVNAETAFTLTAHGAASLSQSMQIGVSEPSLSLWVERTTGQVMPGELFTLNWAAFNAPSQPTLDWDTGNVQATDNDTGATLVGGGQPLAMSGGATVSIQQPTLFTLQVFGGALEAAQIARVGVYVVSLDSVTANPDVYTSPGPNGTLAITATNATGLIITSPRGTDSYVFRNPAGGAPVTTSYQLIDPTTSFQYTVEALGWIGLDASSNPTQTVDTHAQLSLLSFTANPPRIVAGRSTTMSWTSFGATGFTISAPGWNVDLPAGQSSYVLTPTRTTEYQLTATGDTYGEYDAPSLSATVTVDPKPKDTKEKVEHKEGKEAGVKEFMAAEKVPPHEGYESRSPRIRANISEEQRGTRRAYIPPEHREEVPPPPAG